MARYEPDAFTLRSLGLPSGSYPPKRAITAVSIRKPSDNAGITAYFGSTTNKTPPLAPEPPGTAYPTLRSTLRGFKSDCAIAEKDTIVAKTISVENFFIVTFLFLKGLN